MMKRLSALCLRWCLWGLLLATLAGCGGEADRGPESDTPPTVAPTPTAQQTASWSDDPAHLAYVQALPTQRADVYRAAQAKWDTGITREMQAGNQLVIDFLKAAFVRLASFSAAGQADGQDAQAFIEAYAASQAEQHDAALRADGQGGTLLGVMVGGAVIDDLEAQVAETVAALAEASAALDYAVWKAKWEQTFDQ